jgi:hypothetical protein
MGWGGERQGGGLRKGVGEGGRNDPNIVCTYELKKKKNKGLEFKLPPLQEQKRHSRKTCLKKKFHIMFCFKKQGLSMLLRLA